MEKEKVKYHPRNWSQYNKSLVARGSLTLWVNDEVLNQWYHLSKNNKPGRNNLYSDLAIQCAIQIKSLYQLPFRAVQGFLISLFAVMELNIKVPDYSTICRRMKNLRVKLKYNKKDKIEHLAIDASGLKVYGEGEWKTRQHGWSKRRTWRKIHVGIDAQSQEIVCCELTYNKINDQEMFEYCLSQVKSDIVQVSADGIYDTENCYKYSTQNKIKLTVPPRITAISRFDKKNPDTHHFKMRDDNIQHIDCLGKKAWAEYSGYSKRSLVENTMFRFKQAFSGKLQSRKFLNQHTEFMIKCNILNQFARMGMPNSIPIKKVS